MKTNILSALVMISGVALSFHASATCYPIRGVNTDPNSVYYTEPGKGTAAPWDGTSDTGGSTGTLPSVVNLNNSTFQPDGTIIGTGVVPLVGLQSYSAEQILFRCEAQDVNGLYEYYATNGDSTYGGEYEVGSAYGFPQAYQTAVSGMAIRATNLLTGEYYSRYWKARQLTNLDKDSQGWILVKAKNFSMTKVELIRLSASPGAWSDSTTGLYTWSQPATYIAFKGGGIGSALDVGDDSATVYDGWYWAWPGGVNLYNHLTIRRSATCLVDNVTPFVQFPTISVSELQSGVTRQKPININFSCQTGSPANANVVNSFTSGVAADQTAMGILVKPENAAAATSLGFTTGTGVTYLLSDGYGADPTVAKGVGIQISRTNGAPLNLLSSLSTTLGGNNAGWYPVLDDAVAGSTSSGVTRYSKTLNATLKVLPGQTVTPGKVSATAQVIIQVQ